MNPLHQLMTRVIITRLNSHLSYVHAINEKITRESALVLLHQKLETSAQYVKSRLMTREDGTKYIRLSFGDDEVLTFEEGFSSVVIKLSNALSEEGYNKVFEDLENVIRWAQLAYVVDRIGDIVRA